MTLPWSDLRAEIDLDTLQGALQRALPPGQRIDGLQLLKVRRSASHRREPHPVRLSLRARWHDHARARQGWQGLYAKAYRDGASAAALAAARAQPVCPPDFGDALCHVDELDLLLWAWPNDPGLPQLPALMQLPRVVATLPGVAPRRVHAVDVLRYEPEQRAMLRVHVDGDAHTPPLIAKTFADAAMAQTLQHRFAAVQALSDQVPDAPCVPSTLGADPATGTLWQLQAQGLQLQACLDGPGAADALAIAARALARLHDAPPCGQGHRGVSHWHTEIERRLHKIARGVPSLAARAEALAPRLHAAAAAVPAAAALIHGDFHVDQVQIHAGRALFFDFDEFCLGHPMEDVASFGIKLEQVGPDGRGAALASHFEQAYRSAAPHHWCSAGLAWHRAVQALLQAARAFVFQVPGWPRTLEQRFTRAEALALELAR